MSNTQLINDVIEDAPKAKKIDFGKVKETPLKKPSIDTNTIDGFLADYKQDAKVIEPEKSNETVIETPTKKPRISRKKAVEPSVLTGDILTGAMFISIIDLALPLIIATVNNTIDKKGSKIKVDQLRLKASQKKELEPHAEAVMKQLELTANPIFILITALISIYGLNFVNVKYGLD